MNRRFELGFTESSAVTFYLTHRTAQSVESGNRRYLGLTFSLGLQANVSWPLGVGYRGGSILPIFNIKKYLLVLWPPRAVRFHNPLESED
jgi:hypothetical protein